jgi:hypothetical protein
MSLKCIAAVWRSSLPPPLKLTTLALANFADDDGGSIWPSLGTIAKMTGRSMRQERMNLTALCATRVLVPETPRTGGRSTTRYRLDLDLLKGADPGSGFPPSSETHFRGPVANGQMTPRTSISPRLGSEVPPCPEVLITHSGNEFPPIRQDPSGDPPINGTAAPPRSPSNDERRTSGHARRAAITREPSRDGNFRVILRVAHTVLDETGRSNPDNPDLVELVKQRCAQAHIAYGPPGAAFDIVARAVACACVQRFVGRRSPRSDNEERPHGD